MNVRVANSRFGCCSIDCDVESDGLLISTCRVADTADATAEGDEDGDEGDDSSSKQSRAEKKVRVACVHESQNY